MTTRDGQQIADRRAFLRWLMHAGAMVALGAGFRLADRDQVFLRPPGALSEGELLSRCIHCRKCQQICPTGVIRPVLVTEDPLHAGTSRLDFGLGYCNLCMDCTSVCPTGALRPMDAEAVRLGVARIDVERCVAWAWVGCAVCHQECPANAIGLDRSGRPVVDERWCNGCGRCEYACPSSSLRSGASPPGKGIRVLPLGP